MLATTLWETFSKRQKRLAKSGQQDVYQYEDLPERFGMQVIHIWRSALGRYYIPQGLYSGIASSSNRFWHLIYNTIIREAGLPGIGNPKSPVDRACEEHIWTASTSDALDIIELSFRVIDRGIRETTPTDSAGITQSVDHAIEELNHRFLEHGIGYQYSDGILIRVDSQFAHAEIVKPALSLLNAAGFEGPADEFVRAFDHYRRGRNKEAVAEALKAFESTMKSICGSRR